MTFANVSDAAQKAALRMVIRIAVSVRSGLGGVAAGAVWGSGFITMLTPDTGHAGTVSQMEPSFLDFAVKTADRRFLRKTL